MHLIQAGKLPPVLLLVPIHSLENRPLRQVDGSCSSGNAWNATDRMLEGWKRSILPTCIYLSCRLRAMAHCSGKLPTVTQIVVCRPSVNCRSSNVGRLCYTCARSRGREGRSDGNVCLEAAALSCRESVNANQRKEQLRNEAPQLSRITTPRYTVLISAEVRNMIAADYGEPHLACRSTK